MDYDQIAKKVDSFPRRPFVEAKNTEFVDVSGIYIFYDKFGSPLYIGKSRNLKARLKSYFANDLGPKTTQMVSLAHEFTTLSVQSELEALLLEAYLVKHIQPKYNIELKDDKHPLYIRITSDKYPQIITARKIDETANTDFFIGPFASSSVVKSMIKMLRKIFPFSQHVPEHKPCIYSQIGLCNPCPSTIEQETDPDKKRYLMTQYKNNIRMIKRILSGGVSAVKADMVKKMDRFAIEEDYEAAKEIRTQIEGLEYITQGFTAPIAYLDNPDLAEDTRDSEIETLNNILSKYLSLKDLPMRIECYDIAHLSGTFPTASMVTFVGGKAEKSLYRRFRIQQKKGNDDIASMTEVARRRKLHFDDWGVPNLMIIDGGKTQTSVFYHAMAGSGIPIIGLAKRFETFVIPHEENSKLQFYEIRVPNGPAKNLVQRIRDEAHRFARRYHHHLLTKKLLSDF
jgi:excinuclease ABC subunit C